MVNGPTEVTERPFQKKAEAFLAYRKAKREEMWGSGRMPDSHDLEESEKMSKRSYDAIRSRDNSKDFADMCDLVSAMNRDR